MHSTEVYNGSYLLDAYCFPYWDTCLLSASLLKMCSLFIKENEHRNAHVLSAVKVWCKTGNVVKIGYSQQ